ncbi:accessory Sec system protein Asp1 [Staphylococcus lutrae]|uniref:Accessory Sec system protein Asp1 n=2 Tax=Staphylococcus lutrae TaxID=155085 RepID=A0AAC9RS96_9STAP|nr:accessory Sec system protein Asp1 [Staphylococcus lutrae]ARJ50756.1 accessory Sec system protein Asp1 [Staphylococcus lutrae]PNZ37853.1 accessory Sec system protein Asp1 [Staphylococcus lutrae]
MKCFVPAWYSEEKWWISEEKAPFYEKAVTEFDDSISLMGMHVQNKQPFKMLILSYSPSLRLFLHRHDLYEATYWSLFDYIQGFQHQTPKPIDYRELDWPVGTEFMYTFYYIRAITSAHTYTNLYFNQEGYLMWMVSFVNNVKQRCYYFDDRGFLSSLIIYDEKGDANKHYYMTFDGDWVMKEDVTTGEVMIHPKYQHRFESPIYRHMTEVIRERLADYFKMDASSLDRMIVASDHRHNEMIAAHVDSSRLCFSVFEQRMSALDEAYASSMDKGQYWLVDTLKNQHLLTQYRQKCALDNDVLRITPFDVQMIQNHSGQRHEIQIGIWVDGIERATLDKMMTQFEHERFKSLELRFVLMSRMASPHIDWVEDAAKDYLERWTKNDPNHVSLDRPPSKEESTAVLVKRMPFESQLIELMSRLRLVIDMGAEPNLFLQICAIGAGVPQINCCETDYVKHGKNGYVIQNIHDMCQGIDYFLNRLKNWNQSFAYSMKLAKHYASDQIIKQLDAWLVRETDE